MNKPMFLGLFLLFCSIPTFSQKDEAAKRELDAMSAAYKSIPSFQANLAYEMTNKVDNIHEAYNGIISIKGDMYRLALDEQELYNDGITVWTFIPDDNEVNVDNHDPDAGDITPSTIYTIYQEGYKYMLLNQITISGKKYDVIDLVPEDKDAQYFKIRLEIDHKDHLLRKFTLFDTEGSEFAYTISQFNPNVNLSSNFFRFDESEHEGVEVIDLR